MDLFDWAIGTFIGACLFAIVLLVVFSLIEFALCVGLPVFFASLLVGLVFLGISALIGRIIYFKAII